MTTHLALKVTVTAAGTDIFDDISLYSVQIEGKWLEEKTLLPSHLSACVLPAQADK
jgi:hypothetical protein